MNTKVITATVVTVMTLSTLSVFASPIITGDARVDYMKDSGADQQITNRIRLSIDNNLGDNLYVHGRANFDNNIENGTNNTPISVNQAYIGGAIDGFRFKAGKEPLFLGKGLLADTDGSNGLQVDTSVQGIKINGFIGKDSGKRLAAGDVATAFGKVNVGASYLKKDTTNYFGINTDAKITKNSVLNIEYVRNQESKAQGYLAEVVFGDAVKKGDMDYAISYRDIEDSAVDSAYSTDGNYNNSKGIKLKAHYKVTDNATLGVYQDLVDTQDGADKKRTEVEFGVKF